ncbi:MAG: hypothetical protein LBV00_01800 [Propionibacteriaceae bacterium]|jgi:hypothetical protein|nr:hypothetical protein [Propionibacteriaceae bacterium]
METDGGHTQWVSYEEDNPEWIRINDVLASAQMPAEVLSAAIDRAYASFPGALTSDDGDRVWLELAGRRQGCKNTADLALQEIEAVLAAIPKTVTKGYWQWDGVS